MEQCLFALHMEFAPTCKLQFEKGLKWVKKKKKKMKECLNSYARTDLPWFLVTLIN